MRAYNAGKSRASALSILFLLGGSAASPDSAAIDWPWDSGWPKITAAKGTLEEQLETVFGQLSTDCAIWPKGKLKNNISQIPAPIKKEAAALKLAEQVHVVPDDSTNRLMSFLFAEENLNDVAARRLDGNNFVVDEKADLATLSAPRVGSNTVGYRHTCSSYLSAALEAGSAIPMASIAAALKTESTETAHLLLLKGTFENPLYLSASAQDLPTLLRYWKAYSLGNGYTDNLRIIKGFPGVIALRVKSSDRKSSFNVDAKSTVNLPMLNTSLATTAAMSSSSSLEGKQYLTYIYASAPTAALFAPAPPPSQVRAAFSHAALATGAPNGSYLFADRRFEFWADVDSIPADMCNDTYWGMGYPQEGTRLSNSKLRVSALADKGCRFTFSGDAPDNLTTPGNVQLDYLILSRKNQKEKNAEVQLMLKASLSTQLSSHPVYRPPATPVEGARYPSGAVSWDYQLDFLDTERGIDVSRLPQVSSSGQPMLVCKEKSHALKEKVSVDTGAGGRIRLTLRPAAMTALSAGEVCTLKGLALHVPAVSTPALLTRPIEAELLVP